MKTQSKGKAGEDKAAAYLEQKGHVIIKRNFYNRYGEIDIISLDGDELVFTEVKARQRDIETALSSISRSKRRKLSKSAMLFLTAHDEYGDFVTRFDVIVLTDDPDQIYHLENAFTPELIQ